MNLPKAQPDKPGPSISGQWTEVSPNTLCMTQHIGTLTVAEGREWEISVSLNGMVVFVETDLSYSADVRPHHGGATDNRRFMMNALPLVKELAACLLSPPEATPAPQPNVAGYGLFDEMGKMLAWTDEKGFAQAKWDPDRVRPLFAGSPAPQPREAGE
ncbi:hypothetical protein J2045_003422 [Peteryoungia aggregata LMG 23059]|uniref:Uncharacterized protein n=1 Tax=Peteryoungia aggregata LMG 23059 TaxID=1368425 RepID=A0ABU0GAJ4_9HYPH|nr:hypothetical protein [Peteryoungia aggregata]MDQ0422374.1 hypothetical protein [Peteryoungia aggregata LMG 23059]